MHNRIVQSAVALSLLTPIATAQLDVGGFDSSRCRPLSSLGTLGYDLLRQSLTSATFTSTTGCTAVLAAETGTATGAYLADKEVFFVGDGSGALSVAEASDIAAWHANGGALILVGESGAGFNLSLSVLNAIGSTSNFGSVGCGSSAETITSDDNTVTNGPFGDVRGGTFSTSLTTEILPSATAITLVTCSGGEINSAFYPPGTINGANSGGVYFMGDPAWFDLFTVTSPNNLTMALNTFAAICSGGGGAFALQCDPANTHSGGLAVTLANSSLSGPGALHLEATDGPTGEFGYFLVSLGFSDPGTSISNGELCLTQPLARYAPATSGAGFNSLGQFDAAGVMQNIAGTSSVGSGFDVPANLPSPLSGTIQSGTTYYFQCWFRDGTRSNFSNVLQFQ